MIDAGEVAADFNIQLTNDMKIVAYKSENKITNTGDKAWTKEGGLVSVWMLGCFNPTPTTTAVSYTHLDVYKRQFVFCLIFNIFF